MLRDLDLKPVYSTDEDNLLEDFYLPALSASASYDRAVGFFSAAMLSLASQGIAALVERAGSMRLIIGASLQPEETVAINEGYLQRETADRLCRSIVATVENISDALTRNRLESLAWLVASGHLDIRVALRENGMFHDKLGVLTDANGDAVVFQGSANETPYALRPDFNFESINIFQSWVPALRRHFDIHRLKFERLWKNESPNTLVVEFPEAARKKLLGIAKRADFPRANVELAIYWKKLEKHVKPQESDMTPSVPQVLGDRAFQLFCHQTSALNSWKAADFNGILKLATGAGKTITAIYGATKILEATGRLFLVISVPYQNLADQWIGELRNFGWAAISSYHSRHQWEKRLREAVSRFNVGATSFGSCVVVNRTFASAAFQNVLHEISPSHLMIVGDECHHLGSESMTEALPESARYRMGLSATPEHEFSTETTARIYSYFGPPVAEFGLKEALSAGILTQYEYQVVICELQDGEVEEYVQLSKAIAAIMASVEGKVDIADDAQLKILLGKRARIQAHSADKLLKLKQLVAGEPEPLSLFYCGDGSVEGDDLEVSRRHVQMVAKILYEAGWKPSIFTAQEGKAERRRILENFGAQIIDSIAAIRCLDEGIDVPACRSAYILASSRNARQFIQRRGRILRRSPGKERAKIVDFVVTLPTGLGETYELERNLFRAELARIVEFAKLSMNLREVHGQIGELLKAYDLTHVFVDGLR